MGWNNPDDYRDFRCQIGCYQYGKRGDSQKDSRGYSRYYGSQWLADVYLRYYTQQHALFYSDNATTETVYISRNRQLSSFNSIGPGAKLTYTFKQVGGKYDVKATAAYQLLRFNYNDFTDIRNGRPYSFNANVVQLFASATF